MKSFLIILVFLISVVGYSQTDDFQIWSTVGVKYNVNKKSGLNLKQSLRTYQNSAYWKTIFTEASYFYKFNKNVKLQGGYRYSVANRVEYKFSLHRFFIDLVLMKKFNSFKFKLRPRMQMIYSIKDNYVPYYANRWLLELSKKINGVIEAYASTEIYIGIPSGEFNSNIDGFNKYRFTGGVELNITKQSVIDVFYRYQYEANSIIENSYILGLGYKYRIN